MRVQDMIARHEMQFKKEILIMRAKLVEMNIVPETDIRIYPDYPVGWHATVGANNRVYILTYRRGRQPSLEITPCYGFYKNGGLRTKPLLKGD